MYCLDCKKEFFSKNNSCPNCGKRGSKSKKSGKGFDFGTILKWAIIILSIFFAIGIVASYMEKKKEGNNQETSDATLKTGNSLPDQTELH